MQVRIAGVDVTNNKESVNGVGLMDGAVDKVRLEMDVMVHLVVGLLTDAYLTLSLPGFFVMVKGRVGSKKTFCVR